MEEDINILDEVVGRSKELREKDFAMLIGTKQMQSIENLIKGYRELEEKQKSYNTAYDLGKAFANKQWISKVKETIKKLKQMNLDCDTFGSMRDYAVLILQELVEEK